MGTAMGIYGAGAGLGTTLAFAFGGLFPTIGIAFMVIAAGYVILIAACILSVGYVYREAVRLSAPDGSYALLRNKRSAWIFIRPASSLRNITVRKRIY